MDTRLAWLTLSLTDGLGPILARRLVDAVGSAQAAVGVSQAQLRTIEGIGHTKALSIYESLRAAGESAARELERAEKLNVTILHIGDDRYPFLLRAIHAPPIVLYVRGTLEPRDLHAVGIVGSRKCSVYGREHAEKFGANLAGVGVTVASGGARGIDTHAHQGALVPRNGRTIAVLGTGIDIAYPPENAPLFHRIASDGRGAILSEFPLGTAPTPENFPRRNRLVAGLSRGILVVEADVKSGALITARRCIENDRPVFAIPGRIDNPLSAGPHGLIRDGAVLVEKLNDVIDNLGPLPEHLAPPPSSASLFDKPPAATPPAMRADASPIALTPRQQSIIKALHGETLDVDAIADRAALPAHIILQELTMLTLRGVVSRVEGQRFTLRRGDS